MESPAMGPAKQENTPQQEKAKTDAWQDIVSNKERVRETGNTARESSKMATLI